MVRDKKWLLLLLPLVITLLLGTKSNAAAQEGDDEDITIYDGIDIVFLLDQSGSMGGRDAGCQVCDHANDPLGLRFYGPKYALQWLGLDLLYVHEDANVRTAVINFGSNRPDVALEPTTIDAVDEEEWNREWNAIETNLNASQNRWEGANMNGTDHKASFEKAAEIFEQMAASDGGGNRLRAIILLTDGGPCPTTCVNSEGWARAQIRNYLEELKQEVRGTSEQPGLFPYDEYEIMVVAMNDPVDNYWDDTSDIWIEITEGNAHLVRNDQEVGERFVSFILPLTQKLTSNEEALLAPIDDIIGPGFYDVRPYLRRISFTIFKDTLEETPIVISENGQQLDLTGESDSRIEISQDPGAPIQNIDILYPLPGRWRIETTSDAEVTIRVRGIFFDRDLTQEIGESDQFFPVPVQLSLIDSSRGTPPPDYEDERYDLEATAAISWNDGRETISLMAEEDGRYVGEYIPRAPGEHTIHLNVTTHNPDNSVLELIDEEIATFSVRPLHAVMDTPEGVFYEDKTAPVTFRILNNDDEVVSAPLGYTWEAIAEVEGDGETVAITLSQDSDGIYHGQFTPEEGGVYTMSLKVTGEDKGGNPLTIVDQTLGDYTIRSTTSLNFTILAPSSGMEHIARNDLAWLDWLGMGQAVPYTVTVQLQTEDGQPINGDMVGSDNSRPFQATLTGPENVDQQITLIPTGDEGIYQGQVIEPAPFGTWSLRVQPDLNLEPDYVMDQQAKTVEFDLIDNPNVVLFNQVWPIVAGILALILFLLVLRRLLLMRNAIQGTLVIEDEYSTPVPGATWHLGGMRRNRIVIKGKNVPASTQLKRIEIKRAPGGNGILVNALKLDGLPALTSMTMVDGTKVEVVPGELYMNYTAPTSVGAGDSYNYNYS